MKKEVNKTRQSIYSKMILSHDVKGDMKIF